MIYTLSLAIEGLDGKFESIYTGIDGLLRIKCHHDHVETNELIKGMANHCTRRSAQICMITGKKGHRRRDIKGNPCLSHDIYVQYLNEEMEK